MTKGLVGKRVVVVGLSKSGRAAAQLAVMHGADVIGLDLSLEVPPLDGVTFELGPHNPQTLLDADLVVLSPGIPVGIAPVRAAEAAGVSVIGELGFAEKFVNAPILAITGTNGKSTVTTFTGDILKHAGFRTFVGGNLGTPLSELALSGAEVDFIVVEVSSYQMERPGAFAPVVAALLNLTPDHLKRHGSMEDYGRCKFKLFANMPPDSIGLLPDNEPLIDKLAGELPHVQWARASQAYCVEDETLRVGIKEVTAEVSLASLTVMGTHNQDNAAVAATLALLVGVSANIVAAAIPLLRALPHRLESVCERDGVLLINDSKATNIEAALVGINAVARSSVVLLGGAAKGAGFRVLVPALARHRGVICFGGSGAAIADELRAHGCNPLGVTDTLGEGVTLAMDTAQPGEGVLLCPGAASFDEFDNFERRGEAFVQMAKGQGDLDGTR